MATARTSERQNEMRIFKIIIRLDSCSVSGGLVLDSSVILLSVLSIEHIGIGLGR